MVVFRHSPDRPEYTELVKTHTGRVFAICLGILRNIHDAEDISQQTLLKGLSRIKQVHDYEQFGPWICQIAKNSCIDFLRRKKRKYYSLEELAESSENKTKEYPELQKALSKLPEESRTVLMLYYFDGRSVKSVAEALMISQAAAQTRLSRARKKLRKLLEIHEVHYE